jgi:hypothetical protein
MNMKKLFCVLSLLIGVSPSLHKPANAGFLEEGKFTARVFGGANPSVFTDRKVRSITIAPITRTAPNGSVVVFPGGTFRDKTPKFFDDFVFPYIFGVELGYAIDDTFEVFGTVDYTTAEGQRAKIGDLNIAGTRYRLSQNPSDYGALGFYFGGRAYINLGSDRWKPFIGGKIGGVYYKTVHGSAEINHARIFGGDFFRNKVGFSGGAQIGLDAVLADYVSLILMAEAVGSTKPKITKGNTPYANRAGGIFSFPVTAGLRVSLY